MAKSTVAVSTVNPALIKEALLSMPYVKELFSMKFLVAASNMAFGESAFNSLAIAQGLRGLAELARKLAYVRAVPVGVYSEKDDDLLRIANIKISYRGGETDYGEPIRILLSVHNELDLFAEIAENNYISGVYEISYSQEFLEMEMLYGEETIGEKTSQGIEI